MKIHNLTEGSRVYTSNVFLLMGEWNVINDLNTLIDCGQDPLIFQKLSQINTGLGKKKIDQLILTHSHSDHAALAQQVKAKYEAKVYAFCNNLPAVDKTLKDGEQLIIGDRFFEVFHISAHSYDSVCLYNKDEKILFSGDTTFPIRFENETLETENFAAVFRLSKQDIRHVYPGHGSVLHFEKGQFKVSNK